MFFIIVAVRLEWCHLHSSVFLQFDPPFLGLAREKKHKLMTDGPAGYLDICLLLHSTGRERSGYSVTGFHNSVY